MLDQLKKVLFTIGLQSRTPNLSEYEQPGLTHFCFQKILLTATKQHFVKKKRRFSSQESSRKIFSYVPVELIPGQRHLSEQNRSYLSLCSLILRLNSQFHCAQYHIKTLLFAYAIILYILSCRGKIKNLCRTPFWSMVQSRK